MHFLRLSEPSRRPVCISVSRNANLQDFKIRASTGRHSRFETRHLVNGTEYPQDKAKRAELGEIGDPDGVALKLNQIPGVVEHGLFIGIAKEVVIGRADGSAEVRAF
jgi:hypothetical protein